MATVRLFAAARDAAGRGRDELPGATVAEVLALAVERYGPRFAEVLGTCRVWVNGDEVPPGTPVGDADEVAVLPPVSGGADPGPPGEPHVDDQFIDVGAFIRQRREDARLSVRRLAELAGVSNPYLSQIERGLRRPSAEILQQVADALRISVESLYVRAGLLAPDHEAAGGVLDAIERDPDLTPEQRTALADVYRSFVGRGAGSES